jgi:ATP-binding cassette subfamily F protein 3
LDAIVTHIAEIEDGRLVTFAGDYSSYIFDKQQRLARQEELYQVQQREIARLEMARRRYALWVQVNDKFASRLRAMETRLARVEKMERPTLERRRMGLELNGWRGSNKVLELSGVKKSYGDQVVVAGIDLLVRHGERVGLIGPNGAGKSVLLHDSRSESPDAGDMNLGPSVRVGYYAQSTRPWITARPYWRRLHAGEMSEASAAFLIRYLFTYRQAVQDRGSVRGE